MPKFKYLPAVSSMLETRQSKITCTGKIRTRCSIVADPNRYGFPGVVISSAPARLTFMVNSLIAITFIQLIADGSNLVARSVQIGKPVILVTINYRVGVFGFLASKQLLEDSARQVDLPAVFRSSGNLGILDTYRAFEWVCLLTLLQVMLNCKVKENISHFGGDSSRISGIGESAGAGKSSRD